ncbi:unnamed protein product [Phytomonas sp. EM1]|nr:unnamed protein product [Phytomonas sp. EM1]|eukprot:CCW62897.1 unnamed protein product [Phytomonas sp. isolate EM1]
MPAPVLKSVCVPFYVGGGDHQYPNSAVDDPHHAIEKGMPERPDESGPSASSCPLRTSSTTPRADLQLITYAFIEMIAFKKRFFWLHVSESPNPTGLRACKFGACSLAVPFSSSVSTTHLFGMETGAPQVESSSDQTVQSIFSSNLSQKIVRRLRKDFQLEAGVYVSCAIEGERCMELLGTDTGGGFRSAILFGNLVLRESLRLIEDVVKAAEGSE